MIFFGFSLLTLLLAAGAALAGLLLCVSLCVMSRRVKGACDASEARARCDMALAWPAVSIIVTCDDGKNLPELLPRLLAQDYPGAFEVIVVDEVASEIAAETVALLQRDHSNLYMTFTPTGTRNLSRRKLAITLGIKAAAYDYVLLTRADALISSPDWLANMARHFAMGEDVVMGYAYCTPPGGRVRSFDATRNALEWLYPAVRGKAIRGDGRNLGYRRQLFFDNSGFAKTLNLVNGDDDVFLSEILPNSRFGIELSADSMVGVIGLTKENVKAERAARRYTLKRLRRWPSLAWASTSWLVWLWLGLSVACGVCAIPRWEPAAAMGILAVAIWWPGMVIWRRTARRLHQRPVCLTLPWMLLTRPFRTLKVIRNMHKSRRNLTWSRLVG